ncbi:hypothetical protein INR49_022083 [Caranx melampygus]|nr:hypothetical protein INR49_022083 [Caranx melampygus]
MATMERSATHALTARGPAVRLTQYMVVGYVPPCYRLHVSFMMPEENAPSVSIPTQLTVPTRRG